MTDFRLKIPCPQCGASNLVAVSSKLSSIEFRCPSCGSRSTVDLEYARQRAVDDAANDNAGKPEPQQGG